MNGSHAHRLTPQSTPRKATSRARSRATSSSSVVTSATTSLHSTPIKVPVISSASKPQISDDYANANLYSGDGEAVPQLQRTVSDLALAADASPVTSSSSSPPTESFHRYHTEDTEADFSFPDLEKQSLLGSIPQRKPLGSRRSTISASAATTSLNLEIADPVTVCSVRKGAADLLSQRQSLERKAGTEPANDTVAVPSSRKGISPASLQRRRKEEAVTGSRRQEEKAPAVKNDETAHTDVVESKSALEKKEDEESLTRMMGVAQAIVSIYEEDGDKLHLISQQQFDFAFFTSSLQPLRMSPFLREAAASALVPPTKISNLLYVLLVVDNKIVTLLRPRKHSIHPTDLHLLLNVLSSSPALRASETWLPICLPKFNPDGFVYAFISYKLEHAKVLNKIENAHLHHEYSLSDLDTPDVRHFWYKSRSNVQITMPRWEQPYPPHSDDQKRLITLYQHIYDGIHAKSGQLAPLKQFYVRTEFEACMGWSTTSFELYLTVASEIPKHSVVAAANAIVRWIGKEESRLFLRDAPVF
ncbi:hypothetical protein QFC21_000495 [Naganishia friedmannii]|uniref:Uncharacterized protein n=1 Tax=Naganishia friedmannii TaxID=89922 RepID=A0ACC2WE84_9TREE|nr:hypothetical protein QFC21_000495 [Naganishia friedmannii]